MTTVVYVLISILILELLIFVHEFGHYIAGKLLGFRVLGFWLGFGPALVKFKKGETEYALRAFPIGGACQFDGEDAEAEGDPRRFNANPKWKRFIVLFAGPFMNILMAFILAFITILTTPRPIAAVDPATGYAIPVVSEVTAGSAAQRAGVLAGDVLVGIDGSEFTPSADQMITDAVVEKIGSQPDSFVLNVKRNGESLDLPVSGAYDPALGKTLLGIRITLLVDHYERASVGEAFTGAGEYLWTIVKVTGQFIGSIFKNGIHRGDVTGIVGTVGIMVEEAQQGMSNLINIACILSLSLGLFNLIPFPALDGGRILFLIIEAIIGRPLNRKVEAIINGIGLALLFGLMIFVTINDVIWLITK